MTALDNLPPDPEGANDRRADYAAEALRAFAAITCMDKAHEDDATILGDLLANLMHWCDRQGIEFDERITWAQDCYAQETRADA